MFMTAPVSVAFNVKSAVSDEPVVDVGAPPHLVIAPAAFHSQPLYSKKETRNGVRDSEYLPVW
jgi:hypothetical protein